MQTITPAAMPTKPAGSSKKAKKKMKESKLVSPTQFQGKQKQIYEEMWSFYSQPRDVDYIETILRPLVKEKHGQLCWGLINWLVTKYADIVGAYYYLSSEGDILYPEQVQSIDDFPKDRRWMFIDLAFSYQLHLKNLTKLLFDPFRRREHIPFTPPMAQPGRKRAPFETTLCQVKFGWFAIVFHAFDFCVRYKKYISSHMKWKKAQKATPKIAAASLLDSHQATGSTTSSSSASASTSASTSSSAPATTPTSDPSFLAKKKYIKKKALIIPLTQEERANIIKEGLLKVQKEEWNGHATLVVDHGVLLRDKAVKEFVKKKKIQKPQLDLEDGSIGNGQLAVGGFVTEIMKPVIPAMKWSAYHNFTMDTDPTSEPASNRSPRAKRPREAGFGNDLQEEAETVAKKSRRGGGGGGAIMSM